MVAKIANSTWIGVAAVIAAIGSAASSIIGALNARTNKRIEGKVTRIEKNGNGHPPE